MPTYGEPQQPVLTGHDVRTTCDYLDIVDFSTNEVAERRPYNRVEIHTLIYHIPANIPTSTGMMGGLGEVFRKPETGSSPAVDGFITGAKLNEGELTSLELEVTVYKDIPVPAQQSIRSKGYVATCNDCSTPKAPEPRQPPTPLPPRRRRLRL